MNLQFLILCIALSLALPAEGTNFRSVKRIPTPSKQSLPEGAKAAGQIQEVDRKIVEEAVKKVTDGWNTPEMNNLISDDFFDKSRLVDNMEGMNHRDATLRLHSLQGVQTLGQFWLGNQR